MIAQTIRQKIVWSTLVQYGGKAIQVLIGVVTVKLLTQSLGTEDYGLHGKIMEYALFFSMIANLGIFGNLVREMADEPENGKIFWNALVMRIASAMLILGTGLGAAWILIEDPIFKTGALIFMSALFLEQVTSVCNAALQANYRMGRSVLVVTTGQILELGVVLLLIHFQQGLPWFFLSQLASALWAASLTFILVHKRIAFSKNLDPKLMGRLLANSLPFGLISIINNLYYRFLPVYFMSLALSDKQFGSYNLTLTVTFNLALLSTYLMFSTLPTLKASLDEGHHHRAKELYQTAKKTLLGLGLVMVLAGSILGPSLLTMISDQSFFDPSIWFILPLMLMISMASFFYDLALITLFAFQKDFWILKFELLSLALGLAIMSLSLLPITITAKILLILGGSLTAESFMALWSMKKIRQVFSENN